jgi:hypothetical protein
MTADCGGDTTCLLGFCTRVCRADGELIPAACDDVSEASPWGVDFGCAADFDYCLPAATGEEDAVCSSDDDCALPDAVCAGMFPAGDGGAFGVCLPSGVGKGAGAACAAAVECASKLCLATAQAPGGEGTCSRYCKADLDCPAGTLCAMAPLEEEGEALGFAALCQPLAGSLKPCESTADCKIGKETCTALVGPDGGATAPRCLASANPEGLWLGAACKEASDCFDPYCMFETWSANVEAYCTRTCQSDADCSPDTV